MHPIVNLFDYEILRYLDAHNRANSAALARDFGRERTYTYKRLLLLTELGYLRSGGTETWTKWFEPTAAGRAAATRRYDAAEGRAGEAVAVDHD